MQNNDNIIPNDTKKQDSAAEDLKRIFNPEVELPADTHWIQLRLVPIVNHFYQLDNERGADCE